MYNQVSMRLCPDLGLEPVGDTLAIAALVHALHMQVVHVHYTSAFWLKALFLYSCRVLTRMARIVRSCMDLCLLVC